VVITHAYTIVYIFTSLLQVVNSHLAAYMHRRVNGVPSLQNPICVVASFDSPYSFYSLYHW